MSFDPRDLLRIRRVHTPKGSGYTLEGFITDRQVAITLAGIGTLIMWACQHVLK
jgi:hypothetical protein